MTEEFIRFPHTPHLAWLGRESPRGDKVLAEHEVDAFLQAEVVVEEKVDGANVGISLGPDLRVRAQNRGQYLTPGSHPQFGPLWPWLAARSAELERWLGRELILFGEWCFAIHSVRYDRLPDWFLGFDVYDRHSDTFWSTARRNELLEHIGATPVPELHRGRIGLRELVTVLESTPSRVGTTLEGVYLRRETDERLLARAKLVRAEFIQQIEEHWSQRPLQKNQLANR